jgi:SAM-dependent methyltransferase
MARRHGVKNIEFMQMDILDLSRFGRQFDVIECTGVLHHTADPVETGRKLMAALRPGGAAHISLYSELARREIVRLRREYESIIGTLDSDYIRGFRHRLMLQEPATIDALPTRSDFFDLSRCKDLLFHPVEHRFTGPQIAQYIEALGLEFRGFERPRLQQNRYWTHYPTDRRALPSWDAFERRYPDAFADLYEIWCRKPVTT